MIKRLAPALLFLISTPAWAQYCVVERSGAVHSVISADIDGANAKEIITETGPTYTAMTLDPAATAKGYATRDKNKVGFFVYRSGYTAIGKDWREAGSVASNEAGFAIDWPRFTLNGKAIPSVQVELTLGDLHSGTVASTTLIDRKRDGVMFRLTDILENARGFADIVDGEDEFDWYDIQDAWAGGIEKRTDLQVVFRDKAANVTLATVTLRYLSPEVTQAELIKDVNALRAAYAAKKCDPPPLDSFVIPGNNALVLVSDKPIGDLIYYVDENTIVRSKDNSGYDLVTVWTLAVNTKEESTLIGKAAGRWSQHRFNCTTRRYWPDVRSAYLDAANRTYDPAGSSNRKAQTIYKFSVEDYEAQFVCGDLKVSGVRVSTTDALRLARPPAAASPAPATVPPATAQKPPAPAVTTPAPSAAQPAAKPKVWPKPDPRSHLGKGIALYRDLDFQPALVELLAATKADPTDARALAFLSDTYRWLGVNDEEQNARQKALALDPNAFDALR